MDQCFLNDQGRQLAAEHGSPFLSWVPAAEINTDDLDLSSTASPRNKTIALVLLTVWLAGCSGERDESFLVPLHNAIWSGERFRISEFTDFEWDQLIVHSNKESSSSVQKKIGYAWSIPGPPQKSFYTWIFMKHGTVVRYATVHSVYQLKSEGVRDHSILIVERQDRVISPDTTFQVETREHDSRPFVRDHLVAVKPG